MLEHMKDRQPESSERELLPYDPQVWERRVAEARARRAAALGQRDARRAAAASEPEQEPVAEPSVITGLFGTHGAKTPAKNPVEAEPGAQSARTRRRPALIFIAGCAAGAVLAALAVLVSGIEWRTDPDPAGAPMAMQGAAPPAEPAATADVTAPPTELAALPADVAAPPARPAAQAEVAAADSPPPIVANIPDAAFNPFGTAPPDEAASAAGSINRVTVLAPRSVSGAAREQAAALLREAGWPAVSPGTSPFTISRTHVRYYHGQDRPAAEELAALFSAEARDFTSYSPSPPAGMIELWLAGRAPGRASTPNRPTLSGLLGRIATILEGGG